MSSTDILVTINFDSKGQASPSVSFFKNGRILIASDHKDLISAMTWLITAFGLPINKTTLGEEASKITFQVEQREPRLTNEELDVMHQLAMTWNSLNLVVGEGPTRQNDLAEMAAHIHVLQNAILAQAAAREYPNSFRLMGEIVERTSEG